MPKEPRKLSPEDERRIARIQRGFWIGYTEATEIRDELERLFNYPTISRMPNMALIGESNSGKTELLKNFYKRHAIEPDPNADSMTVPVLMIQAPEIPTVDAFYEELLEAVFLPVRMHSKEGPSAKRRRFVAAVQNLGLRMVIVDEAHGMMTAKRTQALILNAIKYLGNDLQVPMVLAGTDELFSLLSSDKQLANRFPPTHMPKWYQSINLAKLLVTLEQKIELKNPSNLKDARIQDQLVAMSDHLLGEIIDIVKFAAEEAIKSGEEVITVELLQSLKFTKPSQRQPFTT